MFEYILIYCDTFRYVHIHFDTFEYVLKLRDMFRYPNGDGYLEILLRMLLQKSFHPIEKPGVESRNRRAMFFQKWFQPVVS